MAREIFITNLLKLPEEAYREKFGYLNTSIPYNIFHRNILLAMEKVQEINDKRHF